MTLASGEAIDCRALVNAAGPFSAEVNRMAGADTDLRIQTRPLRQEVHVIDAPDRFALDTGGTVVNDSDLGTYFRPQPGGTLHPRWRGARLRPAAVGRRPARRSTTGSPSTRGKRRCCGSRAGSPAR